MPNYRTKPAGYKPLTSAHRQTVFLRSLNDGQYELFQKAAQNIDVPHIHQQAFQDIINADRQQLIHGLWSEQSSRHKGEEVGGGLGDAFNYIGEKIAGLGHATWSPIKSLWNFSQNAFHYMTHSNTISAHTKMCARMVKETYKKDIDERADHIGPFQRQKDLSNKWLDVWKSDDTHQVFVSVRGSQDRSDWLVDNVGIATGQGPRDLIGADLKQILEKYQDDYQTEISGHSLGAALVATGIKNYNLDFDRINMFNPGASPIPWSEDAVNELSSDKDAYFYVNAIDPVSAGQLGEKSQNLIVNDPISWTNPIANHSIDQWYKQD